MKPEPSIETQLAALEDWRCVGIALAVACGAVADMLRAQHGLPPYDAPK